MIEYPKTLQMLIDVTSRACALALAEHYSGISVYVPETPKQNHPIAQIINDKDFKALCRHYGGCKLELPSCYRLQRLAVWLKIEADRAAGMTIHCLAQKYQLSARTIRRILKRLAV